MSVVIENDQTPYLRFLITSPPFASILYGNRAYIACIDGINIIHIPNASCIAHISHKLTPVHKYWPTDNSFFVKMVIVGKTLCILAHDIKIHSHGIILFDLENNTFDFMEFEVGLLALELHGNLVVQSRISQHQHLYFIDVTTKKVIQDRVIIDKGVCHDIITNDKDDFICLFDDKFVKGNWKTKDLVIHPVEEDSDDAKYVYCMCSLGSEFVTGDYKGIVRLHDFETMSYLGFKDLKVNEEEYYSLRKIIRIGNKYAVAIGSEIEIYHSEFQYKETRECGDTILSMVYRPDMHDMVITTSTFTILFDVALYEIYPFSKHPRWMNCHFQFN